MKALTVYESIGFRRDPSGRGLKSTIFGFRPGQIVAHWTEMDEKRKNPDLRMYGYYKVSIYVVETVYRDTNIILHGLGQIIFPAVHEIPEKRKDPSFQLQTGSNHKSASRDQIRPLNDEEVAVIEKWMSQDNNGLKKVFLDKKEREINQRHAGSDGKIKIFIG
jgi:hypothetical protein